jgi:hypothetical protein
MLQIVIVDGQMFVLVVESQPHIRLWRVNEVFPSPGICHKVEILGVGIS